MITGSIRGFVPWRNRRGGATQAVLASLPYGAC